MLNVATENAKERVDVLGSAVDVKRTKGRWPIKLTENHAQQVSTR